MLDHYVKQARAGEDYSAVRRSSADERSARRGHRYVTMFGDADERRLLFATPGKHAATFAEDLAKHGGDAQGITDVSLDLGCRAEVKYQTSLRGLRWATLKKAENWTTQQLAQMHWLQRSGLKTARAWRLKQRLREVFAQCDDMASAKALLLRWISWARRCRLAPFKRLGATVKRYLGILPKNPWFHHPEPIRA